MFADLKMSLSSSSSNNPNPPIFRLNENGLGPEVVQNVFQEKGWEEFDEEKQECHDWNLWWRTSRFRLSDYHDIQPWQQLNHFPRTNGITKKDMLARNMKRMKGVYGSSVYNFTPLAFILPNDYTKFVAEYSKLRQSDNGNRECWICKPADLSRGRGIFLFKDLSELSYDCSAVVQRYLSNPLLISGYKFDLRVYVVVLSFHPLVIYIYNEGIVRFSTEKFDLSSIDNQFSHLTNTSINKLSPSYTHDKERIGPGCKWRFATLRNYFHQQNLEYNILWQRISNIVIYTMLAQTPTVPKVSNCFELFGFDILIDNTLKPWLLEVNFSPALGLDCSTDHIVKSALMSDIIDMLSISDDDLERGKCLASNKKSHRNSIVRKSESPHKEAAVTRPPSQVNAGLSLSRSSNTTQLRLNQTHEGVDSDKSISDSDLKSIHTLQTHSNLSYTKPKTMTALYKKQNKKIHPRVVSKRPTVSRSISRNSSKSLKNVATEEKSDQSSLNSSEAKVNISDLNIQQFNNSVDKISEDTKYSDTEICENKKTQVHSATRSHRRVTKSYKTVPEARSSSNSQDNSKSTSSLPKPIKEPVNGMLRSTPRNSVPSKRKPASVLNTKKESMDFKFDRTTRNTHILKPAAKVGDFNLIFPFNEATKRASWPNLDIRTVIRESQKQLRRTMCRGPVRQHCIARRSTFSRSRIQEEHVIQPIPSLSMKSGNPLFVNS